MKKTTSKLAILTLVVLTWTIASLGQEKKLDISKDSGDKTEKVEVLKVFAVTDSNAVFRAYIVKWKNHEVVASDPLAVTNHRVGDTISIFALRSPYPKGKKPGSLLSFQVMPPFPPINRDLE